MQTLSFRKDTHLNRKESRHFKAEVAHWRSASKRHSNSPLLLSFIVSFLYFSWFKKKPCLKTPEKWQLRVFTALHSVITLCIVLFSLTLDLANFDLTLKSHLFCIIFRGLPLERRRRRYRRTHLLRILVHTLNKKLLQGMMTWMLEFYVRASCKLWWLVVAFLWLLLFLLVLSVLFFTPVPVFRFVFFLVLSYANLWVAVRRVGAQNIHPSCQS